MAFTSAPAPGRGPNDVPRDSHGRYLIPRYPFDGPLNPEQDPVLGDGMAQPWTRVSTLAKTIQDFEGLNSWKMRLLAKGIGSRPDLYVLAAASSLSDRKQLTSVVDQALDAAEMKASANLGTALHAFTDQVDRGEDVTIPAPWDADIRAYQDTLRRNDIELIPGLAEIRVVDPSLRDGSAEGTAGTFDRIVMYQGRPTVADLKTGSDPLKYSAGGISIQLGRYAKAWAMWDGEFFRPMPAGLRQDVALVIHLPAGTGTCEVYEVDLEPGHAAVELCMQVREWRRSSSGVYRKIRNETRASAAESTVQDPDQDCDAAHLASVHATEEEPAPTPKKVVVPVKPGGRACSICRRPGHRKGSPKCPGDSAEEGQDSTPAPPADTVPDPARPRSIEEMIEMGRTCPNTPCPGAGWSIPEWSSRPDVTVCGDCGSPSPATLARVTGERSGSDDLKAEIDQEMSDGDRDTRAAVLAREDLARTDSDLDESAFDDDEPELDPRAETLAALAAAPDKATIRNIRAEAKASGLWDDEMLRTGLDRLEELQK